MGLPHCPKGTQRGPPENLEAEAVSVMGLGDKRNLKNSNVVDPILYTHIDKHIYISIYSKHVYICMQ